MTDGTDTWSGIFENVPAGCLQARWLAEKRAETFCPVQPGPQTRKWTPVGGSGRSESQ